MGVLNNDYLTTVVRVLRGRGVEFAPGLTTGEIEAAEAAHSFRFPPDLRRLLQHSLPVGDSFPDWRDPTCAFIVDRLAWPAQGICFDIEHNVFWFPAWGPRPRELPVAQARAQDAVRSAPFLIPVHSHRYLPAVPCETGNPVFSVYQTDIIHYGYDLPDYLRHEFGVPNPYPVRAEPREIEFWSELVRLNNE